MLVLSPNVGMINETEMMFASNFHTKNIREYAILGIKITKNSDSLIISQKHIFRKFRYNEKPDSTQYDVNTHLKKNLKHSIDKFRYTQIIDSLIYLLNGQT